jgi:hypothetical protein
MSGDIWLKFGYDSPLAQMLSAVISREGLRRIPRFPAIHPDSRVRELRDLLTTS